jgi:hypothetical protein
MRFMVGVKKTTLGSKNENGLMARIGPGSYGYRNVAESLQVTAVAPSHHDQQAIDTCRRRDETLDLPHRSDRRGQSGVAPPRRKQSLVP